MTGGLDRPDVVVQVLHVPDCPLVERVRETLRRSFARSRVRAVVEDLEGPYASPTVLVAGVDVTGRPVAASARPSCRLDLPTEEQVLAALESR